MTRHLASQFINNYLEHGYVKWKIFSRLKQGVQRVCFKKFLSYSPSLVGKPHGHMPFMHFLLWNYIYTYYVHNKIMKDTAILNIQLCCELFLILPGLWWAKWDCRNSTMHLLKLLWCLCKFNIFILMIKICLVRGFLKLLRSSASFYVFHILLTELSDKG